MQQAWEMWRKSVTNPKRTSLQIDM